MDWNSDEGKKLDQRLRQEQVIWLTTVRPNGTPIPTPVWFLWDGESFLIYTQPESKKIENIAKCGRAALNLNSDAWGGSVAVFTGEIAEDKNAPPAQQNPTYLEKYREGIKDIGMNAESFTQSYSVPLRFRVNKIRTF